MLRHSTSSILKFNLSTKSRWVQGGEETILSNTMLRRGSGLSYGVGVIVVIFFPHTLCNIAVSGVTKVTKLPQVMRQFESCSSACMDEINIDREIVSKLRVDMVKKDDEFNLKIAHLEKEVDHIHKVATDVKNIKNYLDKNLTQELKLINANIDLLFAEFYKLDERLVKLEKKPVDTGGNNPLAQRITDLERYLHGNMSDMDNKMYNELHLRWTDTVNYVKGITDPLTRRVEKLEKNAKPKPTTPKPHIDHGDPQEVYYELKSRIDGLESGPIANLTDDNKIWRTNFRAINSTFDRMKARCRC